MKNIAILLTIVGFLITACNPSVHTYTSFSSQIIEYQVDDKTYGVVVPEDQGVSASQAKQFARQKAAEVTVSNGGRYFVIQSEGQTQLAKSNREGPSSQDLPGNLYQELIIEQNFGRESLERNTPPSSRVVPAYRIVFQIHAEKPTWGRGIDACTLTECN